MSDRLRALVALSLGLLAGYVSFLKAVGDPDPRDFTQVWYAAGAILRGVDPYAVIGPGLPFEWPAPFLYPLPAAVVALPVATLSAPAAAGVFMAVASGAFAWALMAHGYAPLLGLLSTSILFAYEVAQWSPLVAASVVAAPLGIVLICKPTIGAAMFVARPSWWPVVGGLALALAAFAFEPTWLPHWRDALARNAAIDPPTAPYRAPVTLPGGAVALLALLRWRRPEARLVAALACVPQTLLMYETVPLLLVPRKRGEVALLVALSWAAWWWLRRHPVLNDYTVHLYASGTVIVWLFYLPCVLMVLRRQNEGPVPAWLDRRLTILPPWLRGRPHADAA